MNRTIIMSELPSELQGQIPHSIRSYKDKYQLYELPFNIQSLLEDYFDRSIPEKSGVIFDGLPKVSQDGDFRPINNMVDLVVEYVKNYFLTEKGTYPFDCNWGCDLKKFIQKLDSATQNQLIANEVNNLSRAISSDLDVKVKILDFSLSKSSRTGVDVSYDFTVKIKVNDVVKSLNVLYS